MKLALVQLQTNKDLSLDGPIKNLHQTVIALLQRKPLEPHTASTQVFINSLFFAAGHEAIIFPLLNMSKNFILVAQLVEEEIWQAISTIFDALNHLSYTHFFQSHLNFSQDFCESTLKKIKNLIVPALSRAQYYLRATQFVSTLNLTELSTFRTDFVRMKLRYMGIQYLNQAFRSLDENMMGCVNGVIMAIDQKVKMFAGFQSPITCNLSDRTIIAIETAEQYQANEVLQATSLCQASCRL